ncbi:hypothetical protein SARC_09894 [Sphaeroforma arctica JP610]|uniref:Carbonic anhydrase n=1 Tax=Sphaeroforma arctica JP610 TaxID=667725 RepID=A0A0L0FNU5_9EUKA|nr:hypothetical protein SARC_09894 [Sphaeroforma arctica JP610]KNC77648.1 hypothetical protein SARC_09894 [Sphaeroforma arctica JP610]|eukprot:XP_014151550.1 hypothetical protein SARC_09894 [Sphaeroforma arctica JP610]
MYFKSLVRGRNVSGGQRDVEGKSTNTFSSLLKQALPDQSHEKKRFKIGVVSLVLVTIYLIREWLTGGLKLNAILDATAQSHSDTPVKPRSFLYTEQVKSWGELKGSQCNSGKHQSPINVKISDVKQDVRKRVQLSPKCEIQDYTLVNKGFQLVIQPPSGTTYFDDCVLTTPDGRTCKLLQGHMHTSSEHLLDGSLFDMEAHLVHVCDDDTLAVYGLFFNVLSRDTTEDPGTTWLRSLGGYQFNDWSHEVDMHLPVEKTIDLYEMVSRGVEGVEDGANPIYSYEGSLTTPPCTEVVTFFLQMNELGMSHRQYKALSHRLIMDTEDSYPVNNRKPQALNDRVVYVQ